MFAVFDGEDCAPNPSGKSVSVWEAVSVELVCVLGSKGLYDSLTVEIRHPQVR